MNRLLTHAAAAAAGAAGALLIDRRSRLNQRTSPLQIPCQGDPLLHRDPLTITFYSPAGKVGKSTTAFNAAAVLADTLGSGRRVLLVDGDLFDGNLAGRQRDVAAPSLGTLLAHVADAGEGLPQNGSWEQDLAPHLLKRNDIRNLYLLAAPANQQALRHLNPPRLAEAVLLIRQHFDAVVIDAGSSLRQWTNRFWLEQAGQVFLMVEPDEGCLINAQASTVAVQACGVAPDRMRVVCVRPDRGAVGRVAEAFPQVSSTSQFFLPAPQNAATAAAQRILALEDRRYGHAIRTLVEHALTSAAR